MGTPEFTCSAIGESVFCVWRDRAVLEFSRVVEHRETCSAELSVVNAAGQALYWARLNLVSAQSRTTTIRALEEQDPAEDWRVLVERSVRAVVRHLRTGDPARPLTPAPPTVEPWLVPDWLPRGQISVIFGDGGVGKSYLALALALSGVLGRTILPRWPVPQIRRALYLDWESGEEEQRARLWRLTEGLGAQPVDGAILHRTMRRPLLDDLTAIRGEVARHAVDLVIADSLAPACGPEPETASSVVPVLGGFRSLATTVVVLAHVSKMSADVKAPARPFGSVFVQNLARSSVEIRRTEAVGDEHERSYLVTLYHRKINEGRRSRPIGLTFTWNDLDHLVVTGGTAEMSGASLPEQVYAALTMPKKPMQLAEELDANVSSVKSALGRLANRGKVIRLTDSRGGKGQETQWARQDTNRRIEPPQTDASQAMDDVVPF